MTSIVFDTHALVKKLKAAGVPESQAEAQVEVLASALSTNLDELASKRDLNELETRLNGELKLIKWMLGLLLGGVLALILKTFFPS